MSSETAAQFSETELRAALGQFATGITVVTAKGNNGPPIGITVNSFSSVSLDPPLILFSVARTLNQFDAICEAEAFAINVLTADQENLSNQFAASDVDKWAGVSWREGDGGCPILADTLATFECVPWAQYEGGDHVILVGEVRRIQSTDEGGALIYFRSRYADLLVKREG